jgi:hypothetical protein
MAVYPDTLDDILREYARVKIQRIDIMNHNGAMLAYTDKANMANKLGLTEQQKLGVTPFPSPTNTNIVSGISQDQLGEIIESVLKNREQQQSNQQQSNQQQSQQPQQLQQSQPDNKQKIINAVLVALAAGGLTLGTLSYLDKPTDPGIGNVGVEVEGWQTK